MIPTRSHLDGIGNARPCANKDCLLDHFATPEEAREFFEDLMKDWLVPAPFTKKDRPRR